MTDVAGSDEPPVAVRLPDVTLEGNLDVPTDAAGLVVFAHGSGSSRLSPRNTFVAETLRARGLGTLLFDLLTEDEDEVYENRFDIELLTDRLVAVTGWLRDREETRDLSLGFFGASTGSAAALRAAARLGTNVAAVVSRGGRVDLASTVLEEVTAPTLFIVGGEDASVLASNREAYDRLACEKDLFVVDGATHLFEEPGALEAVADRAADWFERHLD